MALFGKRTKSSAKGSAADWTPVAIHILTAKRWWGTAETGQSAGINAAIDLITDALGTDYAFVLRVTPPGGQPYQLEHQERVPQRVVAPGLSSEKKIPDGIDLPGWARVDDPLTVAIDWSGYGSSPEAKVAIADAAQIEADVKYAQHVLAKQKPKMQQTLRASAWASVSSLAQVVRDGQLTVDEWEQSAQSNLRKTLISQEQYDAARRVFEP